MRRAYSKPALYAEQFALVEHIGSCGYVTNFGNQCPIAEAGVIFFLDSNATCAASEDGQSMMSFAGLDTSNATIEQFIGKGFDCYNSFADFSKLFTS